MTFREKIYQIIYSRNISVNQFERETGINRWVFYHDSKPQRTTVYALAYVLGMTVEELVAGTELEGEWDY